MEASDSNVANVMYALARRSVFGYSKYGVTTERSDINVLGWLQHLQEELMDAAIYIERLKGEFKHVQVDNQQGQSAKVFENIFRELQPRSVSPSEVSAGKDGGLASQ